jgi:hypothetical protein
MSDLDVLEARLRQVLDPYRDRLEAATIYGLDVLRRPGAKAHDWFAGVQRGETAVKVNFLPMHHYPELLDGASPALLKRRTGASVFRFKPGDEPLSPELEAVLAGSFDEYVSEAGGR